MKPVSEMTVTEAASKALEIIISGSHAEKQERYKGYDWYNPNETWQESLATEFDIDLDDEDEADAFANLEENESAWKQAKYEGGEFSRDGYTAERVAEHGGEGEGDQYWVVVSISDGVTTRYFRKDGWYASYDGGYLDGETLEVKPVEKVVVHYE